MRLIDLVLNAKINIIFEQKTAENETKGRRVVSVVRSQNTKYTENSVKKKVKSKANTSK